MRRFMALLLALSALIQSPAAPAQASPQDTFNAARQAYGRGDHAQAARLHQQACDGGVTDACIQLAIL